MDAPATEQLAADRAAASARMRTALANAGMLRALERVALRFRRAGIDLLALKGAALNLTIFTRPDERPMADLDLMVRPAQAAAAVALLAEVGCRPGRPLVRADFFPRFYYEREFLWGDIHPVAIDLHVRPFRPLRYARRVPESAFWQDAHEVQVGRGRVLVPGPEDMLIHLAVHSAVHGHTRDVWLADMIAWVRAQEAALDWDRFLHHVQAWGLTLPAREALARAADRFGAFYPADIHHRLARTPVGWRDRLALRQAPRDAEHPAAHVLVNALCAPGVGFVLAYLRAALLPDRAHMADWYDHRHPGWLPVAHVLRVLSPLLRRYPAMWKHLAKIEVREGPARGAGVFATRVIAAGERIGSLPPAPPAGRRGTNAGRGAGNEGELGKLRYVRDSRRPNARVRRGVLRALRAIDANEEITADLGPEPRSIRAATVRERTMGAGRRQSEPRP